MAGAHAGVVVFLVVGGALASWTGSRSPGRDVALGILMMSAVVHAVAIAVLAP